MREIFKQTFCKVYNYPTTDSFLLLAKKQLAEVEDRIKNGKIAPGGAVSEAELNAKAEAEAIMAQAAAEEKAKLEAEAKAKAEAEEQAKLEAEQEEEDQEPAFDPRENARITFRFMDKNRDGELDEEEFIDGCLADPMMMIMLQSFTADFLWGV